MQKLIHRAEQNVINGLSPLFNREKSYVTNLSLENNLPTFRLNAQVVIRAKMEHSVETSASYFLNSSW